MSKLNGGIFDRIGWGLIKWYSDIDGCRRYWRKMCLENTKMLIYKKIDESIEVYLSNYEQSYLQMKKERIENETI